MYTDTGAIAPKIAQLRTVRRWAWRLVVAALLLHYAAGISAHQLLAPPDFILVKAG